MDTQTTQKKQTQDRFHTASGDLSAYALACGYVQRYSAFTRSIFDREEVEVRLSSPDGENTCFFIRTWNNSTKTREADEARRTLSEARKEYKRQIAAVNKRRQK